MSLLDDLNIPTARVTFGKEASFAGAQARTDIKVLPRAAGLGDAPLNVRWVATGDMLASFVDESTAGAGEQGFIDLPQSGTFAAPVSGFARGTQSFSGWYYSVEVNRSIDGKTLASRRYRFQIPAGTTSMDLDALDEDGQITALPVVAPLPTVTSFLGLTGAITIDQIPGQAPSGGAGGALSGTYPNPGLNESTIDSIVSAKINVGGTAIRAAVDGRVNVLATSVAATYPAMRSTPPSSADVAAGVVAYIDKSVVPPVLKGWDGTSWVALGGTAAPAADGVLLTETGDYFTTESGDLLLAA